MRSGLVLVAFVMTGGLGLRALVACSGDDVPNRPSESGGEASGGRNGDGATGGAAPSGGTTNEAGTLGSGANGGTPDDGGAGGPSAGSGGEPGIPARPGCTTEEVSDIFRASCGTGLCHDLAAQTDTLKSTSELDLFAPGVEGRLRDTPATDCEGKILVVSGEVEQSYFLEKLENARPTCGSAMPVGPALTAEQKDCIRSWVEGMSSAD